MWLLLIVLNHTKAKLENQIELQPGNKKNAEIAAAL